MLYVCKHGLPLREGKQKDGSRPNQQSYFTDCKCSISVKLVNDRLVASTKGIEHNHVVSKEAYESYTSVKTKVLKQSTEAKTILRILINAEASVYQLTNKHTQFEKFSCIYTRIHILISVYLAKSIDTHSVYLYTSLLNYVIL